jgi:hypothetical protein
MECLWQLNKRGLREILAEALATGNTSVNRHFVTTAISIWVSLSSAACSAHAARILNPIHSASGQSAPESGTDQDCGAAPPPRACSAQCTALT